MKVACIWEHNGPDSLIYARDLPGAYARGRSREEALSKIGDEVRAYSRWRGGDIPALVLPEIVQEQPSGLTVRDADSDVIFEGECAPLTPDEYGTLKTLALRSAADFLALYEAVPQKDEALGPRRETFYGAVPRTAREMYEHTKNVNAYYFGEIGVAADNEGSILDCRERGFAALERTPEYLANRLFDGSYGETWSLRKALRRFLWHDRIHGRALYRRSARTFGPDAVPDMFRFRG